MIGKKKEVRGEEGRREKLGGKEDEQTKERWMEGRKKETINRSWRREVKKEREREGRE